jgi:hypothetical protein
MQVSEYTTTTQWRATVEGLRMAAALRGEDMVVTGYRAMLLYLKETYRASGDLFVERPSLRPARLISAKPPPVVTLARPDSKRVKMPAKASQASAKKGRG